MRVMRYETKTAIVIRRGLASWQIANVAAFLAGGLAASFRQIVGEPYRDASGQLYTPLIREPVFVFGGSGAELTRTHQRALSRNLRFAIYTKPLFKTTNDVDNRAAVASCATDALDLVGLAFHADRKNHRQGDRRPQIPRLIKREPSMPKACSLGGYEAAMTCVG